METLTLNPVVNKKVNNVKKTVEKPVTIVKHEVIETTKKEKEIKAEIKKDTAKKNTTKKESTAKKTDKNQPVISAEKSKIINTKSKALGRLRDANRETKTLSGTIKTIQNFWKDGYSDAFSYLKVTKSEINFEYIKNIWPESMKINGVFASFVRVAIYDLNDKGEKVYKLNEKKQKVYKRKLKEIENNFTPMKIFDAILRAKIERKEIII